ncbi:MAG: hypothetical protein K9J17_11285 [Flavobacteriales bacterium]|nr:hypothetical protein [Flavobacteriales bacterium]
MNVEKNEKPLWYLLIISGIFMVINNRFYGKDILNEPAFLIYYFPIIAGLLLVILTRRKFLLFNVKDVRKEKLVVTLNAIKYTIGFSLILNGFILLPFCFVNKAYSEQNPLETYDLEILDVLKGTSRSWASIRYEFNGQLETFSGSKEVYKLLDRKPIDGRPIGIFNIECREGLFGSYVLENWEIK